MACLTRLLPASATIGNVHDTVESFSFVSTSRLRLNVGHTSVALRVNALREQPEPADRPQHPIAHIAALQRLPMSNRSPSTWRSEQQFRPGKRVHLVEIQHTPHLGMLVSHRTG